MRKNGVISQLYIAFRVYVATAIKMLSVCRQSHEIVDYLIVKIDAYGIRDFDVMLVPSLANL